MSKAPRRKANKPRLVGSFFHSTHEDGTVEWQGHVIERLGPGLYLIELFSWWDGRALKRLIATLESMKGWCFYPDAEEMELANRSFTERRESDRAAPQPSPVHGAN